MSESDATSLDEDDANREQIEDRPIAILTGPDKIGAVGLTAARHLEEWGAWVQVVTTQPPKSDQGGEDLSTAWMPEANSAMDALVTLGVSTAWAEDGWELPPADLIIDATQTNATRDLIQLVNSHQASVLSVGTPAGLGPDMGERLALFLSAKATLALGLPLAALASENGRSVCGELYLADIGLSDEVYAKFGRERAALFGGAVITALDGERAQWYGAA